MQQHTILTNEDVPSKVEVFIGVSKKHNVYDNSDFLKALKKSDKRIVKYVYKGRTLHLIDTDKIDLTKFCQIITARCKKYPRKHYHAAWPLQYTLSIDTPLMSVPVTWHISRPSDRK